MARNPNSNSESESRSRANNTGASGPKAGVSSRSNVKQRLTAAQQQYIKDLVKTHITNNHPQFLAKTDPVDFESYSDDFLRRYKDRFQLDVEDNMTLRGYLLGSQLGSKTYSYKRNEGVQDGRIVKKNLASEVKKHFTSYGIKEADCIPQFIYKVKTQKKRFKMEFKG